MEAGSEIMIPSTAYSKSAQMAVKLGVLSAKLVVADLMVRWERKPKKSPPKE
ncbi:hypothetical protein [uncultured Algoriphagus sp.]|uniref:hypothetical protein n=1 Tax=uncultured Algoriphagus sp. TaxID=417365 RepID=UPI0030EE6EE8